MNNLQVMLFLFHQGNSVFPYRHFVGHENQPATIIHAEHIFLCWTRDSLAEQHGL